MDSGMSDGEKWGSPGAADRVGRSGAWHWTQEEVLRALYGDMPEAGRGLRGTRRLMDAFEIDSKVRGGTIVRVCKWLR